MPSFGRMLNRLPRSLVKGVRWVYLYSLDLLDRMGGRTGPLRPPRALHYVGGGDFEAIGRQFVSHFRELCRLTPDESVLDIGSGSGRIAVALLDHLSEEGHYLGFDVSKKGVDWCRENITPRNSRFEFHFSDVYNREYNPAGKIAASAYPFPAADNRFDFVCAISVFTHMLPVDVRHYLREIGRALRPGGRACCTFYLLGDESSTAEPSSAAAFHFDIELDDCFTIDPKTPERAVAYRESVVRRMVREAGLVVREPLHPGYWSGRQQGLTAQDVVILDKPALVADERAKKARR